MPSFTPQQTFCTSKGYSLPREGTRQTNTTVVKVMQALIFLIRLSYLWLNEQRNLTLLGGENTNLGQRELVLNTETAPTHNASSHGCQHYPGYLLLFKIYFNLISILI